MALDTAGDGWRPRMTANGMLSAGGGRMRSDMTSAPAFAQSRGDAWSFRLRSFPQPPCRAVRGKDWCRPRPCHARSLPKEKSASSGPAVLAETQKNRAIQPW